jgi:hypothetical protein
MSAKSRGFPMLRQFQAVALAGALALPAVAQGASERSSTQSPGSTGMLSRFASNFITAQAQYGSNIIAATLEGALRKSRDRVRPDSQPIPDEIRDALQPFYPDEVLKNVRYAIGDTSPDGVAGFAIRNGNAAAVTLIDTIVFKDEGYVRNLALWAHELHHIEQYKDWGVLGFASRYAFSWQDVEAEATAKSKDFVAWYRKRTGQE